MTVQEQVTELKERFGKDAREIADFVYNEVSNVYDDWVITTEDAGGYSQLGKYWGAIVDALKDETE